MTAVEAESGYLDTIDHAIRLERKLQILLAARREAMEVIVSLSTKVDRDTLIEGYELLKEADVPGRKPVLDEVKRNRLAPRPPGWSCRRRRGSGEQWPKAPSWVYVLLDDATEVLYVGKSNEPKTRVSAHNARGIPWTQVELIACASPEDALRLEGDLIHQYAPPWNARSVRARRFIPQEARSGAHP